MDKQAKDFKKGWEEYKKKKMQQTEELIGIIQGAVGGCATHWASLIAEEVLKWYQPKIPENAVVIDRNENPCLSCPVPEDLQHNVDCSTICGAVRLGIDWQNQCKVLVKENKQLTKQLAQAREETAEKYHAEMEKAIESVPNATKEFVEAWKAKNDEICKEITEGKE